MKALTLTQPWAQLMADGRKHYETRSWYPWRLKKGDLLAITASKGWTQADRDCAEAFGYEPADMQRGCVVAVVRFLEAHKTEHVEVSEDERSYGDYTPGRFAWQTELTFKLPVPIPCSGKLGIWELPEELTRTIASLMVQDAAQKVGLSS